MNQELLKIVRGLKTQGKQDDEIKAELSASWPAQEITSCLEALQYMRSAPETSPENDGATKPLSSSIFDIENHHPIRSALTTFLLGLFCVTLIAAFLGAFFNAGLVSHMSSYFGNLSDTFSYVLFLPIATIIFGACATFATNRIYWLFPIAAFYISAGFFETSLDKLLAGYIPISPPDTLFIASHVKATQYFEYLIAIILAYVTLQCVVIPLKKIYEYYKGDKDSNGKILIAQAIILGVFTVCAIVLAIISGPLYSHQERSRAAIRIPSTSQYFGGPKSNYSLYYKESPGQGTGTYLSKDEVTTSRLDKWWSRKTVDACGNQVTNFTSSQSVAPETYHHTQGGVEYAEASFTSNSQNPPVKTHEYTEYYYCFVADYQRYFLIRSDLGGNEFISTIPATQIIDTIAKSKTYLPGCAPSTLFRAKSLFYCKQSDFSNLQKITDRISKDYTPPSANESAYPGVTAPQGNTHAYKKVGQLTISEWGVSIPLSADIKDAYYSPPVANSVSESVLVGLHSLDSKTCSLGAATQATSGKMITIAGLTREKLSDVQTKDPSITYEGTVIGNYVYRIGAPSSSYCLKSLGKSDADISQLQDVFDWANLNIQKT